MITNNKTQISPTWEAELSKASEVFYFNLFAKLLRYLLIKYKTLSKFSLLLENKVKFSLGDFKRRNLYPKNKLINK